MGTELKHWGIKGMKWGIRRYQNADGSLTPAGRQRYSSSSSETSHLSDQELRERISRLELEKRYRDLTSKPAEQKRTNRGKEFVTGILENSARNVGTQLATYALGSAVNKYLGNGKEIVNPKKGQKDK